MKGELCLDFSVANHSHKKLEVVHIIRASLVGVGWVGLIVTGLSWFHSLQPLPDTLQLLWYVITVCFRP